MAGKRRQQSTAALRETAGIVLMIAGFALVSLILYKLGGIYAGLIPGALALMWVGYNMASGSPPPHGTPAGTRLPQQAELPEYRDPDEGLPVGLYERDTVRDLPPVERDS